MGVNREPSDAEVVRAIERVMVTDHAWVRVNRTLCVLGGVAWKRSLVAAAEAVGVASLRCDAADLPGGNAEEFAKLVEAVRASGGVTLEGLQRDLDLSYVEAWDVLDRLRRERVVEAGSVDGFFRVIVDVAPVVGAGSGSGAFGLEGGCGGG